MAHTYTSPDNSDEDRVRFLTGDTQLDGVSLTDAEITGLLSIHSDNVLLTALAAARSIRARIARLGKGRTVNGLSVTRTVSEMDKVISDIEQEASSAHGGISVFGLTSTDRNTIEDDSDFDQPFAKEGHWVNK